MSETKIGSHVIRFEPPDLFWIAADGDVSEQDMNAITAHLLEASAGMSNVLVLADLSRIGDIERDGRKRAHRAKRPDYRAVALYGANFAARIAITLVLGAARLLGKWNAQSPARFFATEAQARAWLSERRRELSL
jgi:hypothetical protein